MKIYTIGFAQKTAKDFFTVLNKNKIECVIPNVNIYGVAINKTPSKLF